MKKIFLVLFVFLIAVSASFALSDNLTVEDAVSDDLNVTNDTNIDNVSKDAKKLVYNYSSPLYEDYCNGFSGFVASLDDAEYSRYFPNTSFPDSDTIKYNQSSKFLDFDLITFYYKSPGYDMKYDMRYNVIINDDPFDLDKSKVFPVYIVNNSIYVGYSDDKVDFEGYATYYDGGITNISGHNFTSDEVGDIPVDNSNLDDQSPVLEQNDTGKDVQNTSKLSKNNQVLETGGPVLALLACLLVSIVGFRRKD